MEDYCISWNHRAVLGLTYSFIKTSIYGNFVFALEDEKSGGGLGSALGLEFIGLDLGGGGGSIFTGSNLTGIVQVSRWWNKPC
jgi:hypothetical protein